MQAEAPTRQRDDWTPGQGLAFALQVTIAAMAAIVVGAFGPARTLGVVLVAFVLVVFLGCLRHGLGRFPR